MPVTSIAPDTIARLIWASSSVASVRPDWIVKPAAPRNARAMLIRRKNPSPHGPTTDSASQRMRPPGIRIVIPSCPASSSAIRIPFVTTVSSRQPPIWRRRRATSSAVVLASNAIVSPSWTKVGSRRRDPPLRIGFDALADVERQLGSVRRRRDRAAVRPGQPVRPLEGEQVLADRLLRDVEPLGEFRDEDAAVLLDHPVDLLLPFLGEHWRPWASNDDGAHPNARSRDDERCGCECVAAMIDMAP